MLGSRCRDPVSMRQNRKKILPNPSLIGCVKGAVSLSKEQVVLANQLEKTGCEKKGTIRYVIGMETSDKRFCQQGSLMEDNTNPSRCYSLKEPRGAIWSEGDKVTFELQVYNGKDSRLAGTGMAIRLSRAGVK